MSVHFTNLKVFLPATSNSSVHVYEPLQFLPEEFAVKGAAVNRFGNVVQFNLVS
jgi:hypothetical protein